MRLAQKLRMELLKLRLPAWHFEPYGSEGAVACYPPGGPCSERFRELDQVAGITSVCGALYVVTLMRFEPGN